MIEIKIALQTKQREFLKKIEETPVTFYGGAKGGGKSKGLRLILLMRRFKTPNSHGAIFRRTYPELEGNHIRPLFEEFPFLREYWHDSKKLLTLPNGSTLQFCHCANENDVDLYQGREFHDLAIDEAGQWTERMFRKLLGSNRSSRPGISARALLTGNPGGIGHVWLKRIFIERRFNERERAQDYAFVQALVDDNPALLENDPEYVHRLNSEPNEALRKAYRFGDWDIFAGQFFGEIRREVHFIQPFEIPHHWNRFGSYDFGFNHPAAFGWFAVDEDGNIYLYREFVKSQMRVDQFAQALNKFEDTKRLSPVIAGLDAWAKRTNVVKHASIPTIAEEFAAHGIDLTRAKVDRVQGATQLRNYLAWQRTGPNGEDGRPRFYIFNTCPLTYECLARMQHDPDNVEDVLKVDAVEGDLQTGDDPYDMTRYGLMSRPMLSSPLRAVIQHGTKEWVASEVVRMEESIDRQAERQQYEEGEKDFFELSSLEPGDDLNVLRHFVNKRRAS